MEKYLYKLQQYSLSTFPSIFKGKRGVYVWINLQNGKRYVGSSNNLSRRVSEYLNSYRLKLELSRGESKIYRAFFKYGYDSFGFIILELVELEQFLSDKEKKNNILLTLEQKYIDKLLPEYNILKLAGSNSGYTMSKEARMKISTRKKGKPSHRKGIVLSDKTRALIRLNSANRRTVYMYSIEYVLLKTFNSIKECEVFTGISRHIIKRAMKSIKPVNDKFIFLTKTI